MKKKQLLLHFFLSLVIVFPLSACDNIFTYIEQETKRMAQNLWEDTKQEYIEEYVDPVKDEWEKQKQDVQEIVNEYREKIPGPILSFFETEEISSEEAQLRAEIIARAEEYPDNISYSMDASKKYGGYKTDCSGFIGYVWQVKEPGTDTTGMARDAYDLDNVRDLKPGDALNNKRSYTAGHVILFSHWTTSEKTSFMAYHMNDGSKNVAYEEFELISNGDGSWTIKKMGSDLECGTGPYYPIRWKGLLEFEGE